ncbi:MAG: DsbC family protein [Smithella sp.]
MKRLCIFILFLILTLPGCSAAKGPSVENKFKQSFPDRSFESISPTPIKGVYEVYTGNQLFYYAPDANVLIYGQIVTKDGVSLTRESYFKKMAPKMAKIPLDSAALKIGNGKNVIVEFLDPDCYHCRQSYQFFSRRNDVTLYVFFYPLSQVSEKKIQHILCSSDRLKAYEEVMAGKVDNNAKLNICSDAKVEEILKAHKKLAGQIGIRATPFFYVKGQVIEGFDPAQFEKLLKD